MAQHRNNHDVQVHPNSGCVIADHSTWSIWLGDKWKVDLSLFPEDLKPFDQSNVAREFVVTKEDSVKEKLAKKRNAQKKNSALYYLSLIHI